MATGVRTTTEPARTGESRRRRRLRAGFLTHFHWLSYTVVLMGLLPLFTAGALPFPLLPPAVVVVALGFLRDEGRIRFDVPRSAWIAATVGILAMSALRIIEGMDRATAFLHVILYLQAYRLLHRKTNREWPQVYLMSFFMMLLAATLTPQLSLAALLFLYVIAAAWALSIFQIKRGIDEAEKRRAESAAAAGAAGGAAGRPAPVEEAWQKRARYEIEAAGIVRPSYLAFTALFTLGTFLATFPVFFAIPRLSRRIFIAPLMGGRAVTGFSDEMDLGAMGRLQQDHAQVMSIEPIGGKLPEPDKLYFRGLALNDYDGRAWRRQGLRSEEILHLSSTPVAPYAFKISGSEPGPRIRYTVFLEPMGTTTLFGIDKISILAGDFAKLRVDDGQSISLRYPPSRQFKYLAESTLPRPTPARRGAIPGTGIRVRWLDLPELEPEIRKLAESITAGIDDPYDAAVAIEDYLLGSFGYSLDLPWQGGERSPLYDFLFVQKRGPCDFFATAMAVFLRVAGVPSRVVYGFHGGDWNPVAGALIVRQSNAHTWVEAYMPGGDWVRFDPTPAASMAAAAGTDQPPGFLDTYAAALRMTWYRYIVNYSYQDQIGALSRMNRFGEVQVSRLRWRFRDLARMSPGKKVLLPVVLILAALAFWKAGSLRLRWPKRIESRLAGGGSPATAVLFYERMLGLLEKKGLPKPPHLTPREFAEALAEQHSRYAREVESLTGIYQQVRFGGASLTPEDRRAILTCLTAIRKSAGPPSEGSAAGDTGAAR